MPKVRRQRAGDSKENRETLEEQMDQSVSAVTEKKAKLLKAKLKKQRRQGIVQPQKGQQQEDDNSDAEEVSIEMIVIFFFVLLFRNVYDR